MNEKKRKKILIIFAVAFILIISWVIYIVISEINKYEFVSVYDLTDLDSVLEYYEINLISRQDDTSNDKNKEYEIYLYVNYPYNTYTDSKTNEAFFMESSEQIARVCGYKNILVVDESKALKVGIKSVNGAFNKIIVNEDENYFSNLKTKLELENINISDGKEYNVNSKELSDAINSNFGTNVNFGTKESIFDNYDIYFDEGIEVKNISNGIFNIVFTSKYKGNIIEDLNTSSSFDEIKAKLGEPVYSDTAGTVIGYKAKNYYIYFSKGQASIYPIKSYDTAEFAKYITEFQNNKSAQTLVNNISEIWPDYDYFNNGSKYIDLRYTLKGVKITFNMGENNGITLYNNFNGQVTNEINYSQILDGSVTTPQYIYIKNSNLTLDNEVGRINGIHNTEKSLNDFNYRNINRNAYGNNDDDPNKASNEFRRKSSKYFIISENYTRYILSFNNENPNSQIEEADTLIWLDDDNLAYSKENQGIYIYNATTRQTRELITGNDNFVIKSYENNTLKYDDKSIECNI